MHKGGIVRETAKAAARRGEEGAASWREEGRGMDGIAEIGRAHV